MRQHQFTLAGWTRFVISLTILTFFVPHVFGTGILHGFNIAQILVTVALVWASVRMCAIFASGVDKIVSLFFWLYVYLFLGLAPMLQLEKKHFSLPGSYTPGEIQYAAVISLVGIAAYELGHRRITLAGRPWRLVDGVLSRVVDHRRVLLLGIVATVFSLGIVWSVGGVGVMFSSRQGLANALGQPDGVETLGDNAASAAKVALLGIPPLVCLIFAVGSRKALGRWRFRRAYPLAWFGVIVVLNLIVNNPITTPRFWFGTVAVAVGALFLHLYKERTFRRFATAAFVGIVLLFPYADRYRYEVGASEVLSLSETITHKTDHDSFQEFVNGLQYVDDEGFSFGRQLLGVATFWVPRGLWQDKPTDTGPLLADNQGYGLRNISAPLWVEGYINFGVAGTAIFLFAFGRISGALEQAWLARSRRAGQLQTIALVVPAFAAYQLILLRGPLLQACGRPAVVLLMVWVCTRSRRATSDTDGAPALAAVNA